MEVSQSSKASEKALKKTPDVKEKKVSYILQDSSSESESEEEIVYVQRKKPRQKKKKKQPKMVYVSDSSEEEYQAEYPAEKPANTYIPYGATPMTQLYSFV